MVTSTVDSYSQGKSKMSDVSRSFLVDSLILKKPKSDHLPVSTTTKPTEEASSQLRGLGAFSTLPQQLAANHQAFHCFPRPPGSGGGLLDLYCPWCPPSTTLRAPGLPSFGMVPLLVSSPSASTSVAASAATASAMSVAATFQQEQQISQQQQQQQQHSNRVMKPVVNRATASSMVQPYMVPQRQSLSSLPGSSAFRPRSLDTSVRSSAINILESRRPPYLGIGEQNKFLSLF